MATIGLLVIASCRPSVQNIREPQGTISTYVVPQAGAGINLIQSQATNSGSRLQPAPIYTTIPSSYVVSDVLNHNLDQDAIIEQVVFYKDARSGDYIQLLIIDYDRRRNSYIRAWEGGSAAQHTASLDVNFIDVTDDGTNELLVYGRDQSGNFTLDVFAVQFTSLEAMITLKKIGVFISESTIGVEPGQPAQIVTEERFIVGAEPNRPPPAENEQTAEQQAVQVRLQVYRWVESTEQFRLSVLPVVANPEVNEQFFQQLIQAPVTDLLQLVVGNWTSSDGADDVFLIINDDNRTLNLQISERQVGFRWRGQFKTIINGFPAIQLVLINENLSSISRPATITLLTTNEMSLRIQGESDLSHNYRRIEIEQPTEPPNFITDTITPSGWYEGITNGERVAIYFHGNEYLFEHPAASSRGTFVIYTLDQPIIELAKMNHNQLFSGQSQYLFDYRQQREDTQIVRAIEMTPIMLEFHGYQRLEQPTIRLLQVVDIRR